MVQTPKYLLIEERLGEPLAPTLCSYHDMGVSAPAIARLLAKQTRVVVTPETIRNWIRLLMAPAA